MNSFLQKARRLTMAASRRPTPEYWREAATLIITAPSKNLDQERETDNVAGSPHADQDSYEILMLQRGASSAFMPNAFVYPGGLIGEEDFDRSTWADIFQEIAGIGIKELDKTLEVSGPRTPMLVTDPSWNELSPNIALRICALRETFEESGLLLVTNKECIQKSSKQFGTEARRLVPPMYKMPSSFDGKSWRKRVSRNASDFSQLCKEYNIVPNVWALFEWSNWLTPVVTKVEAPPRKPRRYDTMFYVCCLERQTDETEACTEETQNAEWRSAADWRSRYLDGEAKMVGPQVYETSRLTRFTSLHQLVAYLHKREPLGMIRYLPVICACEDGLLFVLPEDELYPAVPDSQGHQDIKILTQSLSEMMTLTSTSRFHRAVKTEREYVSTVKLPCGLLSPPPSGRGKATDQSWPMSLSDSQYKPKL